MDRPPPRRGRGFAALIPEADTGFQFPPGDDDVELYFPMLLDSSVLPDRDHRMFDAIARLAHNVPLPAAQAELDATAQQLAAEFPDTNDGWGLIARPLRRELLGDLTTTLWVLSGAVFLVLLTACANIANVLVARAVATGHELAVRAALGANAPRLILRHCGRASEHQALQLILSGHSMTPSRRPLPCGAHRP